MELLSGFSLNCTDGQTTGEAETTEFPVSTASDVEPTTPEPEMTTPAEGPQGWTFTPGGYWYFSMDDDNADQWNAVIQTSDVKVSENVDI